MSRYIFVKKTHDSIYHVRIFFLSWHFAKGYFVLWISKVGLYIKNTDIVRNTFSERNGYKKQLKIGKYVIQRLPI